MVVFPVAKLGYLAVRQISKPLANAIKVRAKNHPLFRNWICMPPAQFYHWIEVNVRMRVMQMGAPTKVSRLSEQQAIELGGEMLGEFIIFTIATACLVAEYKRSSRKEALKEQIQNQRLLSLEQRLREVGLRMEKQSVQIRELTRCASDLSTLSTGWLKKPAALHPALQEATREQEIPHYSAPILTDLVPPAEGGKAADKGDSADADAADSSKLSLLDKLRPNWMPQPQPLQQHSNTSLRKAKEERVFISSAPSATSSTQTEQQETDTIEFIDEHKQQAALRPPSTFMSAAAIEKLTRVIKNDDEQKQATS